jgi:hypothetical protein
MQETRDRIAIRLTREEWEALDDKRHKERLTWQELGVNLLRDWYQGSRTVNPNFAVECETPEEAELCNALLACYRRLSKAGRAVASEMWRSMFRAPAG